MKATDLIKIVVLVLCLVFGIMFIVGISYKIYRVCRDKKISH
jgi:hypothetical protein